MDPSPPTLAEATTALLRRWRTLLGVAAVLAGLVVGYALTLPTTWSATAVVAFTPRPDVAVGSDTVALVVPSYLALLDSPAVHADVAAQLGLAPDALDGDVALAVPPTTATLEVTVVREDPSQVAAVANAFARTAAGRATQDPVLTGEVVSEAVPPTAPEGPARTLLLACGLLAALLAGFAAALLHDRAVPRLRAEGRGGLAGLPLLARMPRSAVLRHPAGEAVGEPDVGPAVRALRDRVLSSAPASGVLVLAVCSAGPREGRTTVAALLAHALTRTGSPVLLVDAHLARQGLTDEYLFALPPADVVDVLEGRVPVPRAVVPTGVPGLSLLAAGSCGSPGDLLAARLPVLAAALRGLVPAVAARPRVPVPAGRPPVEPGPRDPDRPALTQVVVIDTPPLLRADEAALLARVADGVVLVAPDGAPSAPLAEAVRLLVDSGATPLGVVLNRCARRWRA